MISGQTATLASFEASIVEEVEDLQVDGCADLGNTLDGYSQRSGYDFVGQSCAVSAYNMTNVVFSSSDTTLYHSGSLIRGTDYLIDHPPRDSLEHGTKITFFNGENIIGFNRGWRNYYHWIIQCLPAIHAGLKLSPSRDTSVILPEGLTWQLETLKYLSPGIAKIASIPPDSYALCRSATYCTTLNGSTSFCISRSSNDLFDFIAQAIHSAPGGGPFIYIARTDTNQRPLLNEDAVIHCLQSLGFHSIVPGVLSFEEQVATFQNASIIVAPHGAGLTNIVFCRPGSTLYEIFPDHYPNPCFARLAQSRNMRYHVDVFPSLPGPTVHQRPFEADINLIRARVSSLLSSV